MIAVGWEIRLRQEKSKEEGSCQIEEVIHDLTKTHCGLKVMRMSHDLAIVLNTENQLDFI